MKIYIDNIVIRFANEDASGNLEIIGMSELFDGILGLKGYKYLLSDFRKEEFLSRIPELLSSRPNHPIQIVIPKKNGFSPYDEIVNSYDAEPAAGGFVKKDNNYLMIRRLGKWDLPKGKIEKGEDAEEAAIREVEEECGVKAKSLGFLCDTHHMYTRKGRLFIKKTSWYLMENLDDSNMHGQTEEGITEVDWFDRKMLETNLIHSYGNIEDVFLNFLKKTTIGKE
jgi:8-oxo-dGTP pyrophosphatase MutT (NUDIX family)